MSTLDLAHRAIDLAACLADLDREGVARAVALAEPFLPEPLPMVGPDSPAAIAGLPPLTARERLAGALEPAVVQVLLPALRDALVRAVDGRPPQPGAPGAIDSAAAFRSLNAWIAPRRAHPVARLLAVEISKAVLVRATECTGHVSDLLERSDYPDLTALSADLLRLDGLRWLVETLGDGRAQEAIARLSRRMARVTLTRASATMQGFLAQRDLLSLFDNAGVVSQVDNLIVVTLRVLDCLADGEEEATAFVPTAEEEALDGFLRTLGALGEALLRMLAAAAGQAGRESFYTSLLRQVECVMRIVAHLRHEARPQLLDDVERRLRTRLAALAAEGADQLAPVSSDGPGPDGDRRLTQAAELCAALDRLGLLAEAGPLVIRLRAARAQPTR